MDDENINPYEPSPTLTVKQAVMYMLGYRGPYSFMDDTEEIELDLSDYLYHLQEEADCACSNATYELEMLNRDGHPSPEAINIAEERVEAAKAKLEQANKLPDLAEKYRLLIYHEIARVRLGKRSPLVIDEDESGVQPRITTASFHEWLDGMELDDADVSAPVALPIDEDALDKPLGRKAAGSLQVTLGLLVSLYAESRGGKFGTGQDPTVNNIAEKLDEYAKKLNKNNHSMGNRLRPSGSASNWH